MKLLTTLLLLIVLQFVSAQAPIADDDLWRRYPFLNKSQHLIRQITSLDSFFHHLQMLELGNRDWVNVVHIGDSHIQPDFVGQVLRKGLQDRFGNAGRGLIFPYQLAQSNSPDDFRSQSPNRWQFNRLAHPEIPLPFGISGYGIVADSSSTISISTQFKSADVNQNAFNRVRLFGNFLWDTRWAAITNSGDSLWFTADSNQPTQLSVSFESSQNSLEIWSPPGAASERALFGIEFRNNKRGLVYHTIGVNGARVEHYLKAELFWQQLPELNADLYIVSLGTNDVQVRFFDRADWESKLLQFVENLRLTSPGAGILFTSAPESYQYRRPNPHLRQLNESLRSFCARHQIAFYDLYAVLSGAGTAHRSRVLQLMQRDRIHYTAEGYRLMGNLLLNALLKEAGGKTETRF